MPRTPPLFLCWAIFTVLLSRIGRAAHPAFAGSGLEKLDAFQQTITHDEFTQLLNGVYAPAVDLTPWFAIEPTEVRIAEGDGNWFTLEFSESSVTKVGPAIGVPPKNCRRSDTSTFWVSRWRSTPDISAATWAKMEERWFQIDDSKPITEGDMTLRVAQFIAPRLTALGAQVLWVRSRPGPVTTRSPEYSVNLAFLNIGRARNASNFPELHRPI